MAERIQKLLEKPELLPDPTQFNQYARSGRTFFRLRDQPSPAESRGGGGGRFSFGGLYKDGDTWRVRIGEGVIVYREIFLYGDFGGQKSKSQYCRPVFPTVEVNGNDVRIDDPSSPSLELGDRGAATVWLVAKKDKCNSSSTADGRLVISDRDEDPDVESSEDCIEIVSFDVEVSEGGEKRAIEIERKLQSDHHQSYVCDKGDSSEDSYDGSDMDDSSDFVPDSSSDMGGSTPSGSSDEESDDGPGDPCDITVTAGWEDPPNCLPAKAGEKCVADKLDSVTIRVKFHFPEDFGQCQHYAYGVKLVGGIIVGEQLPNKDGEYRWRDDVDRLLTWKVLEPPACGTFKVIWQVKTFAPLEAGPLDPEPPNGACCNQPYSGVAEVMLREYVSTGRWDPKKTKLPNVCGCTCSSSGVGGGGGA